MSKHDMLGPIVRALVGVPHEHHGVILDAVNKLGGANADAVRSRIVAALRDEPLPPPAPLDTVIRVDRSIRPAYPDWVKPEWTNSPEFMALEATGPAEYGLAAVQLWFHDGQENGTVVGNCIYDHLKSNNMLEGCLGLSDLLEVQKKGITVYRKFFAGKVLFGWKSVVQRRLGLLDVPFLIEVGGGVALSWDWLADGWDGSSPAARFAS